MRAIMENGDYEAFKAMTPRNEEMAERHNNVTEEQFNKMVEAHNLRQSGDYEAAMLKLKEISRIYVPKDLKYVFNRF